METESTSAIQWISLGLTALLTIIIPLVMGYGKHYIKSVLLKMNNEIIAHITEELKKAVAETRETFVTKELHDATEKLWQNQVDTLTRDIVELKNVLSSK